MAISKLTFDFLEALKENNNREWFAEHKDQYQAALDNVLEFIQDLILKLSSFDPEILTTISAKQCLFRIYRDVRFSKDKSPYKPWCAAGISLDGRKLEGPEYYLHLEPGGKSFLAVGYWRPKKEHLDKIRQEIDYNFQGLQEALASGNWTIEDLSDEDKLVRPPAGYEASHQAIEVLKLKSFVLFIPLEDKQVIKPFALEDIVHIYSRSLAFKNFLHQAIDM